MGNFFSKHRLRLPLARAGLVSVALVFLVLHCGSIVLAEAAPHVVANIQEYFPDQQGNEWTYRGRFGEGGVVQIAEKAFVNVSTVIGEEIKEGISLTVFHDTNPGDQGPSDSFYHRDAAGIRYYGSKPGTTLEKQLVPYQIVRYPLEVPSSFEQLNRKGLDLGLDLDRDGQKEQVDVHAVVSVLGQEMVTVPLGTYKDAVKLEAKMTMEVHLSRLRQTVRGTDTMIAWFGRGVGLLKYVERQTIPSVQSKNDRVIEVTEELEKATIAGQVLSSRRGEATAKGILADYPVLS